MRTLGAFKIAAIEAARGARRWLTPKKAMTLQRHVASSGAILWVLMGSGQPESTISCGFVVQWPLKHNSNKKKRKAGRPRRASEIPEQGLVVGSEPFGRQEVYRRHGDPGLRAE